MALNRDSDDFSDLDFSEYVFSEYTKTQKDGGTGWTESARGDARRQRGSTPAQDSARTGRHQASGRHSAPEPRRAERRSAAPEARQRRSAAPGARPAARRRASRGKGRHRGVIALLALVLVIGAVFIAVNFTIPRVKNFEVRSTAVDQQLLSWDKSGGVVGYDIYDGSGKLLRKLSAGDTQYAVSGLQSGTQYTYSIVAVKEFLGGEHSGRAAKCSGYTLLEPVSSVTAATSGTGVQLNWQDSGASGYEVQYTDRSGVSQTVETNNGGAAGLIIPDLPEGTQYTFQLRGFLQDGESRIYSDWTSSGPFTAVHAIDLTGIDINKPMIALTFDDGPDTENVTARILDVLKQYGGHVTFFQLGNRAEQAPGLMSRMAQEGHEIACHTYDHTHSGDEVTADDIIKGNDAIEHASGKRPSAFRSPQGETTNTIRQVCVQEGMPIIHWILDTEDWRSRNADSICEAIKKDVSDGDIILMHNIYDATAEAVERIVPYLTEEGYQLVTVSQLIQAKTGQPPVPGRQYYTATVTD